MANIKSQIKRIKTNEKARQRNKATKSALKTSIRRFREAAAAGDTAKGAELAAGLTWTRCSSRMRRSQHLLLMSHALSQDRVIASSSFPGSTLRYANF